MRIKENNNKQLAWKEIKSFLSSLGAMKWIVLILIGPSLILTMALGSIYLGMALHKSGQAYTLNRMFQAKLKLVPNFFKGLTVTPERMTINIKHMDYQKIAYKREVALQNQVLITSADDYVPAEIQYKDKTVKARIRLKGDLTDGLKGNTWPFRVKIRGEDTLLGMKRFSIHHPKVRNYIYEWVIHQALRREGVLSLRYKFITVTLNGKNKGVYALEEHFGKRLIENNQHREGPIIKFNEDILWKDRLATKDLWSVTPLRQVESLADIDAFRMNSLLKNSSLRRQFAAAKDLLELFRTGKLPTPKVFAVKKLAKYFAVSELMSGLHGVGRWHNLRFYYNPITSLLEPIGFDTMAGVDLYRAWESLSVRALKDPPSAFHVQVFKDIVFYKEYIRTLKRLSQKSYLDSLFKDIDTELNNNLNIIYSSYPYFVFSKDAFYRNQRYIHYLLNPVKGMHAYFHKADGQNIELSLGNIQSLPIEVRGLAYKDLVFLTVDKKVILSPRIPSQLVKYKVISFLIPENFVWADTMASELKVKYSILGTGKIRYEQVFPYARISPNLLENDFIRQPPNVEKFSFLSVDEASKRIFVKPGNWDIEQSLIIPAGYKVICSPGTQLNLSKAATILSYSPFEFRGEEEHYIIISSSDSTGQGLILLNAGQTSIFRYVVFDNLSNPQHKGWELTGAVTFYESPVEIEHCQFLNNKSEDALNIIRSDFTIDKTFFKKSYSDAFDADFCKGTIKSSSFIDCANDAIDVSGSQVEIHNLLVEGAGDKALSVGEGSKVLVDEVKIKQARIGMASKDMSELKAKKVTIDSCEIGLAVYQKKSEFGPGSIRIEELIMDKVKILHLVEKGSTLQVGTENIEGNQDNLKEKIYNDL